MPRGSDENVELATVVRQGSVLCFRRTGLVQSPVMTRVSRTCLGECERSVKADYSPGQKAGETGREFRTDSLRKGILEIVFPGWLVRLLRRPFGWQQPDQT